MSPGSPRVSAIMATFNGARYVEASVRSLLNQTLRDMEVVIVDDASVDATPAILAKLAAADTRVRVLTNTTNQGVVAARNRAFEAARAPLVASMDHDDLSQPVRLAQQAAALAADDGAVLACSDARQLRNQGVGERIFPGRFTHEELHWKLHLSNPIVQSTIMFRRAAVDRLGGFMRAGYEYADDFDFYHRITRYGRIVHIPSCLIYYRLHDSNAATRYNAVMAENARRVLRESYGRLLDRDADAVANLVARLVAQKAPPRSRYELEALDDGLARLCSGYAEVYGLDDAAAARLRREARGYLEAATLKAIAAGHIGPLDRVAHKLGTGPTGAGRPVSVARGKATLRRLAPPWIKDLVAREPAGTAPNRTPRHDRFQGYRLSEVPPAVDMPPTLAVVVDTEAEFDWNQPFDRDQTAVANIQEQGRAQEVFDAYGLRPFYLVDYPVASDPAAVAVLSTYAQRGACHIGAHLQPWTTPPFDEDVTTYNSYVGNLPPALEEAKLVALRDRIVESFGTAPRCFKAGRYGLGATTFETLAANGFTVDFSLMPGASYAGTGGPDFRGLAPVPYTVAGAGDAFLAVPMTRNYSGALAGHSTIGDFVGNTGWARRMGVPGIMARTGLLNCVPLSPEGVSANEACTLIDSMLRRGYRTFVLHYHSSSLLPGYTPYAQTSAERDAIVDRISTIVRYFVEQRGGMPGLPRAVEDTLQRSGVGARVRAVS
jgi:glycosyltransferase involved in cell wall biosynthesis